MKSCRLFTVYLYLQFKYFISYYLTYSQGGNINKFSELNISEFKFILYLKLLASLVFCSLIFSIIFESTIISYLATFLSTSAILIIFLWVIKFVNLSRAFTLFSFLIFLIVSIFITRFIDSQNENIYISFEKDLCDVNENFYFADHLKFPQTF